MSHVALLNQILAVDYDGTLADDGFVDSAVVDGLREFRASGRHVILVTGRELDDLTRIFTALDVFDRAIVENGAVLYRPSKRELIPLASPPSAPLIALLRRKGVTPLAVGKSILATHVSQESHANEAIRELRLDVHIVYNKDSLMILPSDVDKGTGLKRALDELGVSQADVIGIGDAENDLALFDACAYGVAVANAVPALKERAQFVTTAPNGRGVLELMEKLLETDIAR